jgi:ribonuclease Z
MTLHGCSTALFATWWSVEEHGLLFDCGDGLTAALLQRARKVKHVFISHADRDHLTGLLQFVQLNARDGYPVIHYPRDCGSFRALADFSTRFDPHVTGAKWEPVEEGVPVRIGDLLVEPVRNGHVAANPDQVKSLSYRVWSVRRKLKTEFTHLSGNELRDISQTHGKDHLTDELRTSVLDYSGDTPVEDPERFKGSNLLIHEATFLQGDADTAVEARGNKHSTLEEVMGMAAASPPGALVLGHFSARYSAEVIDRRIKDLCEKFAIGFPVHRVLPGLARFDILSAAPVNV